MQLCLTEDELKLLAEILEFRDAELRAEPAPSLGRPDELARKRAQISSLLGQVIDRELRFSSDELDSLAELLAARARRLHQEIAGAAEPVQHRLRQKQTLLDRLLDKVTEACAMA